MSLPPATGVLDDAAVHYRASPPGQSAAGGTPGEDDTLPSRTPRRNAARRPTLLEHLALVVGAFLPQLLTHPGVVDADTKTYLYVDPGRYLGQSLSMWDPTVGLGTVTHQQIGYLFPMGPFFWATHAMGVPTWIAERLWIGLILFAAGSGAWWLARLTGLRGPGRLVAAAVYMLSPYTVQYIGHISVILLAFAALPWLVVLVDRAAAGSWRAVAGVGLVVAAMGSVNASSAIYVGVGPLVWLGHCALTHRYRWAAALRALGRCGLAALLISAWWIAGLLVEGGYGIDVLRYTETVQAVSTSSLSSEVLRGLGYWYFYGGDNFGPWVSAMPQFTQQVWLIGVGYCTPLLALTATVTTRWRHRRAFLAITVVGMVLAVGAYPFSDPSPVGRLLRALLQSGTVGLALRSTDRATPLVLLGLATLLGAGTTAAWRWAPGPGLLLAGVALGAAVAANPALWNGTSVPSTFSGVKVAGYERQAANVLNHSGGDSAVLGVPGQNFASTFLGTTVDPIWPALLTRPFVTREEQVMGSLATEDLLYGMDDPLQQGVENPAALAPLARLMGVGDLLVQNDLAFTRYDQPDPAVLWASILSGPAGLGPVQGFGPDRQPLVPSKIVDEQTYTLPADLPLMPSLVVVPVHEPRPLVRAEASTGALLVDGDGVGLDDIAGTGLLSGGDPAVVYAGTLDSDGAARRASYQPGATLVVTDTNRRQAFRWDNLTDVADATLAKGQSYPSDPDDRPLDIFPGAPADAQTTTGLSGVASVTASGYGNPFQYLAEDRPVEAIDGDPETSWQVGPFEDPRGQWWQVELDAPRTADSVTLLQPQNGTDSQWITTVTLTFDGRSPLRVTLGPPSRRAPGQVIHFPARRFRTLRVTIDSTNVAAARTIAGGFSAVGLAEVGIDDVTATEQVVMPSDLLRAAGGGSLADRLLLVMTRLRVAPATSRTDPEEALVRTFWLPTARTFTLTGQARIDSDAPDALVDELVGRTSASGAGRQVTAFSSGRLQGDVADTASAALDDVPGDVWSSPLGDGEQVGQAITVDLPSPITFDQLHLRVVVDGRHSVPSELRVSAGSDWALVTLPKLPKQDTADGSDPVTVSFAPLTGSTIRVTVLAIRPLRDDDYYALGNVTLPVAIAQLGIAGVQMPPPPAHIPSPCRSDLLRIDGTPVPIRVSGTSAAALSNGAAALSVSLCGADAGGLRLGPGPHQLVATPGRLSGLDLDQLVLDSGPGGGPEAGDGAAGVVPPPSTAAAAVHVLSHGATAIRLRVTTAGPASPFWLVLGESLNRGWRATVVGGPSLGPPVLVDGFANGWLVAPSALGGRHSVEVVLRWTPQSGIDVALVISLVAGVLAVVAVLWPRRRRRAPASDDSGGDLARPELALTLPSGPSAPSERSAAPARLSGRQVVGAALGAGLLGGLVTTPAAGVAVALAVAGCALVRRRRLLLGAGAVAAVLATALTMVVVEAVDAYPGNGQWPAHFTAAAVLTWLALVLAVAETLVRARPGRRPPSAGTRPAAPTTSPPPSPAS